MQFFSLDNPLLTIIIDCPKIANCHQFSGEWVPGISCDSERRETTVDKGGHTVETTAVALRGHSILCTVYEWNRDVTLQCQSVCEKISDSIK